MRSTTAQRCLGLTAVAGAALSLTTVASAQPYVINISGATLQENFFNVPQSTNDFIGVDGERGDIRSIREGFTAFGQLQLAGSAASTLPLSTGGAFRNFSGTGLIPWWVVQYRAVGSGNGLTELAKYGITGTTSTSDIGLPGTDAAYCNVVRFILEGTITNAIGNIANPGAFPVRGNGAVALGARYLATPFTLPADGASSGRILIDIAPVDVPSDWFVGVPGSPDFVRTPQSAGYGQNVRTAVNKDGTAALYTYPGTVTPVAFRNSIAALPPGVKTFAQATAPGGGGVDSSTILETPTVFVPVAAITNFGTGATQVTKGELRHLFATGRLPSGENLMAVTRDVGSGTRNAFMSSLQLDTSWGVGENIGALNVLNTFSAVGEGTLTGVAGTGFFVPSNKGGSGALETTVQNHRLAIGQTGAERGNGSWLTAGRLEVLAVKDDLAGGTQYVRPTSAAVLNNGLIGQTDPSGGVYAADGYRIGGPAVLAHIGDPRNVAASKGGYGYNGLVEANPGYPQMRNSEAAAYLNNITRSIDSFVSAGPDANAFSPAERLATTFILFAAVDRVPTATNPVAFAINPQRSGVIESWTLTNSRLAISAYNAFGNGAAAANQNPNGIVPTRNTRVSGTYSDGTNGSAGFKTVAGGTLNAGAQLNSRNRISGDFDGNGVRNINDTAELIAGWKFRAGTNPSWTPADFTGTNNAAFTNGNAAATIGTSLCPEIIGDFDGNGSFDTADVRYFADGLATLASGPDAGKLDRKQGFIAVDNAFGGNFFGTTLAHGTYSNGDARADVSGASTLKTPNFAPIGFDGTVNGFDIDYVYGQFKRNARVSDGALNWDNTSEAIGGDLSCDITGDRIVDQADVLEILSILETSFGDVNLDGTVDAADLSIINANQGTSGGWAQGDITGDGLVNALDVVAFPTPACNLADITEIGGSEEFPGTPDGQLTVDDLILFVNLFSSASGCPGTAPCNRADVTGIGGSGAAPDGDLTVDDLIEFVNAFSTGC